MKPILQIHRTVFGRQMPMYVVLAFLLAPIYKTAHATMHEIRGFENLQTITPLDFQGNAPPNDPHAAATGVFVDIQSVVFDSQVGTGVLLDLADPDNPDNRVPQWVFREVQIDYKSVTWETVFSKTGSWWRDKSVDGELLQHEKGHINLAEILARKLNALSEISVQELNKQAKPRIIFKDTGLKPDEAKAEAERKLKEEAEARARALRRTVGAAAFEEYMRDQSKATPNASEGRYDQETGHGTTAAQNTWNQKFEDILTPQPTDSQILRSRSDDSIQFDAATKSLSFTEDFVIGIVGGPSGDPLIGAGVRLPRFVLQGTTSWGDPLFAAQDNQEMSLSTDLTTHLMGRLPYLIYTDNTFHGVNSLTTLMQTDSAWIERQRLVAESGEPFLIGIHLIPDENFQVLTTNFTLDGETSFSNFVFQTQVVSEPSSLHMVVLGLACLLGLLEAWNTGRGCRASA